MIRREVVMRSNQIRLEPISYLLSHPRVKLPACSRPFHDQELCAFLSDVHSAMRHNDYDYFFGSIILTRGPNRTLTVADGRKRLVTIATLLCRIRAKLFSLMLGQCPRQRGPRRAARIIDDFLDRLIADTPNSSPESTLRWWHDFVADGVTVVTATVPRSALTTCR
jgi:hypothetical protein